MVFGRLRETPLISPLRTLKFKLQSPPHDLKIHIQRKPGGVVAEMVFVAEKADVVGLVVEAAFVAQVDTHAAGAYAEACSPAPGKLVETRFVTFHVGEFRGAVEVVVTHRTAVKQQRTEFEAHHQRHVEVVVGFVFHQLLNTEFLDAVIGAAGIEHKFGLKIDASAEADITAELVSDAGVFESEDEGAVAAAHHDVGWFGDELVHTAAQTEGDLSVGGGGEANCG